MNTNERIRQLMDERNWTEYRLAKESKLSQSTIANLFKRNTVPSVTTLDAICGGFGITLAQFFSEGNIVELSDEQKEVFDK
ncbi:DNA-binding protein [Clostridia bacterium]|nr:DNA-binding protein [Clostridia bacterium]